MLYTYIYIYIYVYIIYIYIYIVGIIGVTISPNIIDKLDNNVPAKLDFVPFFIFKQTDFKILVLNCNQDGQWPKNNKEYR